MNLALGRGATAVIYKAEFSGIACAAKIYNQDRRLDQNKITAMLENPPSNVQIELNGINYPQLAWPFGRLQDNSNRNVGYLMPLVDLKETFSLDHFYDQVLFKKMGVPSEGALSFRLEIARNLCLLVADLHDRGHFFIDMKPQNIRVWLGSHVVTLVDCDGFSIASKDGPIFPAELLSSDYIAPEAYRSNSAPQTLGEAQDCYALSVIIFQLLNRGTHPFQGIIKDSGVTAATNDEKAAQGLYPHGLMPDTRIAPRPQSIHHLFDDGLRSLFDKAFTGLPVDRPKARYWANRIDRLLRTKALARCSKEMFDIGHMRFSGKECPACYIASLPNFRAPTPINVPKDEDNNISSGFGPTPTYTPPEKSFGEFLSTWWLIVLIVLFVFYAVIQSNKITPPTTAPAPVEKVDTATCNLEINSSTHTQELCHSWGKVEAICRISIEKELIRRGAYFSTNAGEIKCQDFTGKQSNGESTSRSASALVTLHALPYEIIIKDELPFNKYQTWNEAITAFEQDVKKSNPIKRDGDGTWYFSGVSIAPFNGVRLNYGDNGCNIINEIAGLCQSLDGGIVCQSDIFNSVGKNRLLCVTAWLK